MRHAAVLHFSFQQPFTWTQLNKSFKKQLKTAKNVNKQLAKSKLTAENVAENVNKHLNKSK